MEQEHLDARKILDAIDPETRKRIGMPEVFQSIDSTNSYLMGRAGKGDFHGSICLAEEQTAGRGRRGRTWVSPFGANIYLSMAWQLRPPVGGLGGLSIAIGMQVVRALRELGVDGVGLKWPNDIMLDGKKVAGILVEVASARRDRAELVAGIGINRWLEPSDLARIDTKPAMLGSGLSRNILAGQVIVALVQAIEQFADTGLTDMADDWECLDVYFGCPVEVSVANEKIAGVDRGIDGEGNLLLDTPGGLRSFNAGEVSLRSA